MTAEIKKQIKKLEAEAKKLEELTALFPDLKEETNRWGTKSLYSALATGQATGIETYHSCGCCLDIPLLASPYLKVNGTTIFGAEKDRKMVVVIGRRGYDYGDTWVPDWRELLEGKGIPEAAIESIAGYANVETYD